MMSRFLDFHFKLTDAVRLPFASVEHNGCGPCQLVEKARTERYRSRFRAVGVERAARRYKPRAAADAPPNGVP